MRASGCQARGARPFWGTRARRRAGMRGVRRCRRPPGIRARRAARADRGRPKPISSLSVSSRARAARCHVADSCGVTRTWSSLVRRRGRRGADIGLHSDLHGGLAEAKKACYADIDGIEDYASVLIAVKKDESYWAGAILVTLANLRPDARTWRSLWGVAGRLVTRGDPRWRRLVRQQQTGALDRLQREFTAHLGRYTDDGHPLRPSGEDLYVRFAAVPRVPLNRGDSRACGSLRGPADRHSPGALVQRTAAGARDDPATTDGHRRRRRDTCGEGIGGGPPPLCRSSWDRSVPTARYNCWRDGQNPTDTETLAEYVDGLFLRAARGGLWPRFFQCVACGAFNLRRAQRADARFCVGSDACRRRAHYAVSPKKRLQEAIAVAFEAALAGGRRSPAGGGVPGRESARHAGGTGVAAARVLGRSAAASARPQLNVAWCLLIPQWTPFW